MNNNEATKDIYDNYNSLLMQVNNYRQLALDIYNNSLTIILKSNNQNKVLECYNIINKDLNKLTSELNDIHNEFNTKCVFSDGVDTQINSIRCLGNLMDVYEKYDSILNSQINDLKILISELSQEEQNG